MSHKLILLFNYLHKLDLEVMETKFVHLAYLRMRSLQILYRPSQSVGIAFNKLIGFRGVIFV